MTALHSITLFFLNISGVIFTFVAVQNTRNIIIDVNMNSADKDLTFVEKSAFK